MLGERLAKSLKSLQDCVGGMDDSNNCCAIFGYLLYNVYWDLICK